MKKALAISVGFLLLVGIGVAKEYSPPSLDASAQGDDVKNVALTVGGEVRDNPGQVVSDAATGHGDRVSAAAHQINNGNAVPLNERKGRNPQTGKEIKIPARTTERVDTVGEAIEYLEKNAKDDES